MLEHGGKLRATAAQLGIAPKYWLDLSTGINPHAYPVPAIPTECWQRLPEEEDGLADAAAAYYRCDSLLATAGSQAAIQTLPRLRARGTVGILGPTYGEHAHAWRGNGHSVLELAPGNIPDALGELDALVVVNPNNPTGLCLPRRNLLQWHDTLRRRGGWLIVDEAFADCDQTHSLGGDCPREGLIVLRSLGKFFGLAGARVGFTLAPPALLRSLAELLGPWPVGNPARLVARTALTDRHWQQTMRKRLPEAAERLRTLLRDHGLTPGGGTDLFVWVPHIHANQLHARLLERAILVRRFDDPPGLRFGLPATEADWQRLDEALRVLTAN